MISVENYSDEYRDAVLGIVQRFHAEALSEYQPEFDAEAVLGMITKLAPDNSSNAFLLIVDGQCVGLLAGVESPAMFAKGRIFQELIWYVDERFRRYGVQLFKKVKNMLHDNGFAFMIMAVLENSKCEKIQRFYKALGFKPMESHWVRAI